MSLGHTLKRLRRAKGLTQAELAKRARISDQYVWLLESGARRNPSLAVLRRLAGALGSSVRGLVEKKPKVAIGGGHSMSVSIQVVHEPEGLRFGISAGRAELKKRLREAGITYNIPRSISISFDQLHNFHYYLGEIRGVLPLAFGITPNLGIGYQFVDQANQPINFTG